ncbi:MAG: glutaminase A [Planctomycetota bacterium]
MLDYLRALHERVLPLRDGETAGYIPELARADPDRFGISVVTTDGRSFEVGDHDAAFSLQSISKPLVYGLALESIDSSELEERVGVEPTGDPFNSIVKLDRSGRPHNPLINPGAIAVTDLIAAGDAEAGRAQITAMLGRYAGRPIAFDKAVFRSERETGHRNRAIAHLLRQFGRFDGPLEDSLDLYFRQCAARVTAHDLAVVGATLANAGANPVTGARALGERHVGPVLSLMLSCGMYDYSGQWAYRVGLPAKSGVGGGICVVVPGRMGIGVYSPRLDERGNSVRGLAAVEAMSRHYCLHVFGRDRSCASLGAALG